MSRIFIANAKISCRVILVEYLDFILAFPEKQKLGAFLFSITPFQDQIQITLTITITQTFQHKLHPNV